jgi:glucosamine-6-phosphate deaminase
MKHEVLPTPEAMGRRAAEIGGDAVRAAIDRQGHANIVVATGASQFEVFRSLTARKDIDWSGVTGFHLDEYIGLPLSHPASFRKYLKERFVDHLPLAAFHYVQGDAADAEQECRRLGELIAEHPIDVMFCGIGENGHLAFNDPPADFDTREPYIIVELDEACRRQQHGEGWFEKFEDVPTRAISMSIQQIMKSRRIVCSVPDERKANAVKAALTGPVTPEVPASILQRHEQAHLLLDEAAASRL